MLKMHRLTLPNLMLDIILVLGIRKRFYVQFVFGIRIKGKVNVHSLALLWCSDMNGWGSSYSVFLA